MSLLRNLVSPSLWNRRTPRTEVAPAPAPSFTHADWNELFEHWHRARAFGPERVMAWRERREVGRFIHNYPADEQICRGGRCGLGPNNASAH